MQTAFTLRRATSEDAEASALQVRCKFFRRLVGACIALLVVVFARCFAQDAPVDADADFLKSFADPFLADGFDFPVGDANGQGKVRGGGSKDFRSWRVASKFSENGQSGEEWSVSGGGHGAAGQPVFAVANGRVIYAEEPTATLGSVVIIEHQFLENGKLTTVFSRYARLKDLAVMKGQSVKRRAKIGTVGAGAGDAVASGLHFEIRKASAADFAPGYSPADEHEVRAHYESPTVFIKAHRKSFHPATTPELLLAVKHRYQLHRFENGTISKTYEIALSQNPIGHKLAEGDLRLPEGEYHIIQKAKGPFAGRSWMKYLGAAWLRIDYPNSFDAAAALAEKRITKAVHDSIGRAHRVGKMPPQDSPLGGGIGVHGWKSPGWNPEGDRHITWGCISLNEADLLDLSGKTKVGTPIIIVP